MNPGDLAMIDFPGHVLHGARVRIERIEPKFDLAHEDCDERMFAEVVFYSRPGLPGVWGIGRERLAGTPENARLREAEAEDGGAQMEMML